MYKKEKEVSAAIIIKQDKILLVKKKGRNEWVLPGGKIKNPETQKAALRRELSEELPYLSLIKKIKFFGSFDGMAPHGKYPLVVHAHIIHTQNTNIGVGKEIEQSAWVKKKQLPNLALITAKIISSLEKQKLFL